jgi:predicted Zn-dependent protease
MDAGVTRLADLFRRFASRILLIVAVATAAANPAEAQRRISIIRDAEIENTIRAWGAPLFAMAGLDPSAVRVHLIKDNSLNAFVAGGQNIFINTGLLLAADTPNQVIGVIAHETGHIAGGHLARMQDALRGASAQAIIAMVLGAAVMAAGGGDAGAAVIAGGAQVGQRTMLAYSRTQEGAADNAALSFLDQTQQSSRGLMEFLEKLGDQEALQATSQDPYVRTHPISRERVETVRAHVEHSPYSDRKDPPAFVMAHQRMKAKIHGFFDPPEATFRRFPESDQSVPARYARAIALHQAHRFDEAVAAIDKLIAEQPKDPYFHETKGQFLLESGRVDESVPEYETATRLSPDDPLLRLELGAAQASARSDSWVQPAIQNLEVAARTDPTDASAWRWLAQAYGRDNQEGMAALATAERYMLNNDFKGAAQQADRAARTLPEGPSRLRARDLKEAAEYRQRKSKD